MVGEIHVKVLNNIFLFFISLKNSECKPKMITCVKGGPQRRDVVKVCGTGEFLSRYKRLKCYLARSQVGNV